MTEPRAGGSPEPERALDDGMVFEGLLVLPKPARIDGRVAGRVLAGASVLIGESGVVEADLEAEVVVVEGRVEGRLRAHRSLTLGARAVVIGDLWAPNLTMAEGARIEGRCHCGEVAPSAAAATGNRGSTAPTAGPGAS